MTKGEAKRGKHKKSNDDDGDAVLTTNDTERKDGGRRTGDVVADRPVIRILRTHGPLFVCEDPSLFLHALPQVRKKHYGDDHISVEELEYLGRSFDVVFACASDAGRRVCLRERHAASCRVYRHLTDAVGLRLRHGSQFGAAFIGYRDVHSHGEYLVYLGPLSRLEEIAAVRVACSVAKEAWVAEERPDGSGVLFTKLDHSRRERSGKHQTKDTDEGK